MNAHSWILAIAAAGVLVCATPAVAQYMYLDSNGDGVSSAADVMNANGTATPVDVYLISNRNRDGTEVVCNVEPSPLTVISYVVSLHAQDGIVTYGNFVNRQAMPVHFGEYNPGNGDYKNGYGGFPPSLPAGGPYQLCSMTITGVAGSPSIQIVDMVGFVGDYTSFGGACSGHDFDNTYKLTGPFGGSDWTDVDGLGPGTGTPSQHPPQLDSPSNMTVSPGEMATQIVSATDVDGQYLSFELSSAPVFLDLTPMSSDRGTASVEIFAGPWIGDVGVATATMRVSDGEATDEASFQVTVPEGPNHVPFVEAPADVTVPAGGIRRIPIRAGDADGQTVAITRPSGPSFASLRSLVSREGTATAYVEVAPGPCDGGRSAEIVVEASDALASTTRSLALRVPPGRSGPEWPDSIPLGERVVSVAIGDLNGDGRNDILAGHIGAAGISVLLSRPADGFASPARYPLQGEILDLAIEDLNGDGWRDVVAVNAAAPSVPVWINSGGGALQAPVLLPLVSSGAQNLGVRDLNGDARPDLIVPNAGVVSVFMRAESGLFHPRRDWRTDADDRGLAVEDYVMDGRLDILASSHEGELVALQGRGGGTFRGPRPVHGGENPFRLVGADFNWDGFADLATSGWERVMVHLGDGAGGYVVSQVIGDGLVALPDRFAVEDLDLDGNPDLEIHDLGLSRVTVLYGHGDGTFGEPIHWSRGYEGLAVGDLNGDGWPDMASGGLDREVRIWWNPGNGSQAMARAFTTGTSRVVPVGAGGPSLCLRFEPVDETYPNDQVDLASLVLHSTNTGSVESIPCIAPKSALSADQDGNGIEELPACFSRGDLTRLFEHIRVRTQVAATLTGRLLDGRAICSQVDLTILPAGPSPNTAYVAPNPFNPRGMLHLTTSKPGALRVHVFDIQGRLVRTLVDRPLAEPGTHQFELDGRDQAGRLLGSGVYFYVAETSDGAIRGRFAIMK